jgi:single-strand DNA-binding protein
MMNKIILIGRLARDPEIRYTSGDKPMAVARYSLAVDKKQKRDDGITADFFNIVAFDRFADFAEKYLRKGIKIAVSGHVQTGTYINNDGVKIPFFEVVAEEQEFAEGKNASQAGGVNTNTVSNNSGGYSTDERGFINVPDDMEELPFN